MSLKCAVFAVSLLSMSEAWLMYPHMRTSWTARHFGASNANDDRNSDLSPEILGSPQWLENLSKTHRSGYYPASWSSTLKPHSPSSMAQKNSNQYYNEPGSMLSRKSALSSSSPGRPSWSSPSTDLKSKVPSSPNAHFVHPDVSTSIRIQYCPISTDTSSEPSSILPSPANSSSSPPPHKTPLEQMPSPLPPPTPSSSLTRTSHSFSASETVQPETTISEDPLPYPEYKMMSFLDGGQHILHGNIADFAEEKSQKNLQVVQAKKELFPQEPSSTNDNNLSTTDSETGEISDNDVVDMDDSETSEKTRREDHSEKDSRTEKEKFAQGEMTRWEEAARRDAHRRANKEKKKDTYVHRPDEEGIDLNGLQWNDETPPDTEKDD